MAYYNSYAKQVSLKGKTKNKYGACKMAGFDSKGEYQRSLELDILEKAGLVKDIKRQVKFDLYGKNGTKVCFYKADFVYYDVEKQIKVIEDFKGLVMPLFRLKWKLLEDNYKEEIRKGELMLLITH